ncbi:MAG: adenine phosphoribosyltransferase, partial [Duncaniella sp.]|nr:adenine phosphoribosyltransferase [Duncaniella sp.]
VVDFPQKGVIFRDLTTLFKDPRGLHIIGWDLSQLYRDKGITKVVGIESRGFIGGSILAFELGAGFVPARKPGKLPADTIKISYDKEYGKDIIEIHRDAITPDDIVVIHDDVLATGGTMAAAYELVKQMNPKKIYINFIVELSQLGGRANLPEEAEVVSLITY